MVIEVRCCSSSGLILRFPTGMIWWRSSMGPAKWAPLFGSQGELLPNLALTARGTRISFRGADSRALVNMKEARDRERGRERERERER